MTVAYDFNSINSIFSSNANAIRADQRRKTPIVSPDQSYAPTGLSSSVFDRIQGAAGGNADLQSHYDTQYAKLKSIQDQGVSFRSFYGGAERNLFGRAATSAFDNVRGEGVFKQAGMEANRGRTVDAMLALQAKNPGYSSYVEQHSTQNSVTSWYGLDKQGNSTLLRQDKPSSWSKVVSGLLLTAGMAAVGAAAFAGAGGASAASGGGGSAAGSFGGAAGWGGSASVTVPTSQVATFSGGITNWAGATTAGATFGGAASAGIGASGATKIPAGYSVGSNTTEWAGATTQGQTFGTTAAKTAAAGASSTWSKAKQAFGIAKNIAPLLGGMGAGGASSPLSQVGQVGRPSQQDLTAPQQEAVHSELKRSRGTQRIYAGLRGPQLQSTDLYRASLYRPGMRPANAPRKVAFGG